MPLIHPQGRLRPERYGPRLKWEAAGISLTREGLDQSDGLKSTILRVGHGFASKQAHVLLEGTGNRMSPGAQEITAGAPAGVWHTHYSYVAGISPAMRALDRLIEDIAPTDIPIIISGESGAGKDMVSLEFHRRSSRTTYLKCSCARSSSANSITKWSAGASGDSAPMRTSTTFYFDEIDQLDPPGQDWLLELLTDRERQAPERSPYSRVISATTANLEQQMQKGRFNQRLYYLVNGIRLHLPPLRDRQEDIPPLFDFFLSRYGSIYGLPIPQLDATFVNQLLKYEWPGNVRELENFARKAVVLQDLPLAFREWPRPQPPDVKMPKHILRKVALRNGMPLKEATREASRKVERALILKTLERTGWNRKQAAIELQISYKALLYKVKQLDLDSSDDSHVLARETT